MDVRLFGELTPLARTVRGPRTLDPDIFVGANDWRHLGCLEGCLAPLGALCRPLQALPGEPREAEHRDEADAGQGVPNLFQKSHFPS